MKKLKFKRCWIEVDLEQIKNNIEIYKKNIPTKSKIIAVVKADAYGHGAVRVAKKLQEVGIGFFAVSNLLEAIELRKAGIKGEIIILGYTPTSHYKDLIKYDLIQTLISQEYAEQLWDMAKQPLKVHFAIDTGMKRIGINADMPRECEQIIREYSKKFNLLGIFTHLCVADIDSYEDKKFTRLQIEKFERIADSVSDLKLPHIHCLNSAGGIFANTKYNKFIRLGIMMYGLKADYSNSLPLGVEPVLTWKSVISMIKTIQKGESVGYGRSFTAKKEMKIATIPTGYADGYNRKLSNKGYVLIHGQKAKIVGRICMDQFMVDITNILDTKLGDEVILLGNSGNLSITADDMAHLIGTIGYEIVCNIAERVQAL